MSSNDTSREPDFKRMESDAPASRPVPRRGSTQNPATTRFVVGIALFSAALGAGTTWAVTRAHAAEAINTAPKVAMVATPPPVTLVPIADTPKPPPAPAASAASVRTTTVPKAPKAVVAAPTPVKTSLPALPEGTYDRTHALDDLDRCIAGDGKGCNGVGRWYEGPQNDAFSATRWYEKGCELSNTDACDALDRLGHLARIPEKTL